MRRTLVTGLLLASLLLAGVPVQAKPLPQTLAAADHIVRDVLHDADHGSAKALRQGYRMIKELRAEVLGLGVSANGELDIRASFAQPVVRGQEDFLALSWIASKSERWTGVYWIESNAGTYLPRFFSTDIEGSILFLESSLTSLPEEVSITYHFVGIDGKHTRHHVGVAKILDFMPLEDHADFGAVAVSHVGHEPEAIFLTPWNVLGRTETLGFTLLAGDHILDEVTLVSCADYETESTEYGCRLLYISRLPPELTHVVLWHLDEAGERSIDRTLERSTIDAGYQFTA